MERILGLIGEPYYSSDNCVIYNMDCVAAMERLSNPKEEGILFDLTVTIPSYNIGT